MDAIVRIFSIADALNEMSVKLDTEHLDRLMDAAEEVGKSWSGSWLGYHSRVYYRDLKPVPASARFSKEYGLMDLSFIRKTVGDWVEYDFDDVVDAIHRIAGSVDLDEYRSLAKEARSCFEESQSLLLSTVSVDKQERKDDAFLDDLVSEIRQVKYFTLSEITQHLSPSGQQVSRDTNAILAGSKVPPHVSVIADVLSLHNPFQACEKLSKLARRVASHLESLTKRARRENRIGTSVFIGHGQSPAWKELKDFIQERLHLPWDEFNRVPVAGVSNIARLSNMLDEAAIAFLVLTAEDEQADSKMHARMNIIHEVGLFQGRLGFERAVVLLEEGCEEFSNIQGLGQLRFPKGNIGAVFEDIRRVLEREELIE